LPVYAEVGLVGVETIFAVYVLIMAIKLFWQYTDKIKSKAPLACLYTIGLIGLVCMLEYIWQAGVVSRFV